MKTTITKSKAGYYTVAVQDDFGHRVFHRGPLSSLYEARRVLNEELHRRIDVSLADLAKTRASIAATPAECPVGLLIVTRPA